MGAESRRAPRFPFIASAELIEVQSETRLQARTSDLSVLGCYIDTMNPFPAGTQVRLKILHSEVTFAAAGKVIHAQSNMGMGVAFTAVEPASKAVLEKWIAELTVA